ncbi:MAG: MFS transporter [Chloroflexi bacterium]|nr:MFS transporter [Chloroflexota bacterium]
MIRVRTNKDIWRYSFGVGFAEFLSALVTALLNYYYVRTMGLSNGWYLAAQSIYAIYNALNDPLVGYLTNKRYGFSKRFGRNYPWIMLGGIGALIFLVLIYDTPFRSQIGLFIWMLLTLCITDTFFSIFSVNHQSLSPNIFTDADQRRRLGAISTVVSTFSMLLGFIVPEFGDISSPTGYTFPMMIGAVIGLGMLLILRPSVKEEPELTEKLFAQADKEETPAGFFGVLKESFKHRNFLLFIVLFLCFNTLTITAISSLPYFLEFVMNIPAENANSVKTLLIMVEFVGVFISIPAWSAVIKKKGMKITTATSAVLLVLAVIPIFFVSSITGCYVVFFLIGLGVGGFWVCILPLLTDTIDEITASVGRHNEGVYFGIKVFFSRIALIIQAVIYWVVRGITGFTPQIMQSAEISDTMKFGIRFEMVGASALLLLISTIIFAANYDLGPEKMAVIRSKIDAMHAMPLTEEEK